MIQKVKYWKVAGELKPHFNILDVQSNGEITIVERIKDSINFYIGDTVRLVKLSPITYVITKFHHDLNSLTLSTKVIRLPMVVDIDCIFHILEE